MMSADEQQRRLIESLSSPTLYDHPVEAVERVETHISYVLLAGDYAYKIKKPLDLGFLDFSTLEKRRFCCHEELRLNRRLAPDLYLAVVPITGTPEAPHLGGEEGEPIEYAVKMARFPQDALLDRLLARNELTESLIDRIAHTAADFHGRVAVAGPDLPFGTPERVHQPVAQNFEQIRPMLATEEEIAELEALRDWSEREFTARRADLAARKEGGFIRECHGDMHLGNMALVEGELVIFDGIEFNENLRWIDVMSETAFLVMDLEDRGREDFASRFLNGYLEYTGDYAGLAVLRYYQAYRAMVRAKVARIRLSQEGLDVTVRRTALEQYTGYIRLARRYSEPPRPALIITHGVSGSGKTTATQPLLPLLGAVRVRSDVERKRSFGLAPDARSGSGLDSDMYAPDATRRTYDRLAELAADIVKAGFPAVVDATFLDRGQRQRFRVLAQELGVPFAVLSFDAPPEVLRERVATRAAVGLDASEAGPEVLESQLRKRLPFGGDEAADILVVDTSKPLNAREIASVLKQHLSPA